MNGLDAEELNLLQDLQKIGKGIKKYLDEFKKTCGDFITPNFNVMMTHQDIEEFASKYIESLEKFLQWMKEKHPEASEEISEEADKRLQQFIEKKKVKEIYVS
jgi:flavin-dependent dehydrogenase